MAVPTWVANYIGIPYRDKGRDRTGFDCWGLVRAVLLEVAGITLPDYANAYTTASDRLSVAAAVEAGLANGWECVEYPQALDLLILKIAGRSWHCGVMVEPKMFLHAPPPDAKGRQLLTCIERLDAPCWSRRVDGIYRRIMAD